MICAMKENKPDFGLAAVALVFAVAFGFVAAGAFDELSNVKPGRNAGNAQGIIFFIFSAKCVFALLAAYWCISPTPPPSDKEK
jgi:hypothetical protein